jgi:hypothetical protein
MKGGPVARLAAELIFSSKPKGEGELRLYEIRNLL